MARLSASQRAMLEQATMQYMEAIDLASEYLGRRGITPEVAATAALGVVTDPILGHESYRGRLAIPYLTESGPINMTFRCIQNHNCKAAEHPKYMKLKGSDTNLYNVQAYYDAHDYIVITEGEIDALTLSMAGIPAIGVAGAESWKQHWNLIFLDFQRVFVFSDGDDAGQKFAEKVVSEIRAINIPMPNGMDVNDVYLADGPEALLGRIGK